MEKVKVKVQVKVQKKKKMKVMILVNKNAKHVINVGTIYLLIKKFKENHVKKNAVNVMIV